MFVLVSRKRLPEILSPEDAMDAIDEAANLARSVQLPDTRDKALPGVDDPATMETIRTVVALEYRGYNDKEISSSLDKSDRYVEGLRKKYWQAFHQAKAEHSARVFHEYGYNMQISAAGLSRAAIIAVRTLVDLMGDAQAPPKVKLEAANSVLNAVSFQRNTKKDSTSDLQKSIVVEIQNVMNAITEKKEEVIDVGSN